MNQDELNEYSVRIDLLVTDPDSVRAPWTRLARPVLARFGWQPTVKVVHIKTLLETLRSVRPDVVDAGDEQLVEVHLAAAIDELRSNVVSVERACVINRRAPVAHAAWLRNLLTVITRASRACENLRDPSLLRIAVGTDNIALLPPLSIRSNPDDSDGTSLPSNGTDVRLLEMQLGGVDHLLAAARDETEMLERRRRLLEAARQMLLETSAALPVDQDGMETRRSHIAREIVRIDRLQACGVAPDVGLTHQAQSALSQGNADKLNAILQTINASANARGDIDRAHASDRALARMWRGSDPNSAAAIARSIERSAVESFGQDVTAAVLEAYEAGRSRYATSPSTLDDQGREFYQAANHYLQPGTEQRTLSAALAVDGCFEVGGAMNPIRVTETEKRVRSVVFPTARLALSPARTLDDVSSAVIEDPRMTIMSLAAGKLLTRKFLHDEEVTRTHTALHGEVRVFVLDGSGSMIGPRARMRDAILVSELATLSRAYQTHGRTTRVKLFYCYFNDLVGPTYRVDSSKTAIDAISDVLNKVRTGGTEIENALIASFRQISAEKVADLDLARAQVVLITDGEARVREQNIDAARATVGELPIGLSVIALGQENVALRALVARQRAAGERAFYHFIPDEALIAISEGTIDTGGALHLPPANTTARTTAERSAELTEMVGGLVDEIATLGRLRDTEAFEALDAETRARREVGLDDATTRTEGERAKTEAVLRDRRALSRRFSRWFPAPKSAPAAWKPSVQNDHDGDELDAAIVALATVTEVISVVGGTELARQADAIDIFERLLPDARLSPSRYETLLQSHPEYLSDALHALHQAVQTHASRT